MKIVVKNALHKLNLNDSFHCDTSLINALKFEWQKFFHACCACAENRSKDLKVVALTMNLRNTKILLDYNQ